MRSRHPTAPDPHSTIARDDKLAARKSVPDSAEKTGENAQTDTTVDVLHPDDESRNPARQARS